MEDKNNITEYLYPSANQFVEYFKNNYPGQTQEKMLLLNYFSPEHALTSEMMSVAMGWKAGANIHYGRFAGKIAEEMGFRLPNENFQVSFLATFEYPEDGQEENRCLWTMRPELIEAIHSLNWDTDEAKKIIDRDLSNAELMLM